MKPVKVLTGLPYRVIASHFDKNSKMSIIITAITEENEKEIDAGHTIRLTRGNTIFTIEPNNVLCYGVIDFNTNSSDMDMIKSFDWISKISQNSVTIPSNYDYKNHCAYSDLTSYRWFDTYNTTLVVQYSHGVIGKPKRTIIFKQYYGKH